tara:strand:+ start:507 stop:716 length:210 start_codon:yes stop_codon:yes gene_type:complete
MQFDSFSAFISMEKYGFYVWLSYGAALLLLAILVYSSVSRHKRVTKSLAKRQIREQKLREARAKKKENS